MRWTKFGRRQKNMNTHNSFAYYKLPNRRDFRYIGSNLPPLHFSQLRDVTNDYSGFLIVPFDTEESPILLISPETEEAGEIPVLPLLEVNQEETESNINETYRHQFEACKTLLNGQVLQKIVLAHCFVADSISQPSVRNLFLQAASAFPKCYVSLWHTAETGLWLTITPEVLLESTENTGWHTVALAGTMQKEETEWSEKNKMEQQYVADYITNVLKPFVSSITHSAVQTIEAAQLKHLRTDFYFTSETHIGKLLEVLHPTPAVCGLPKTRAYEVIKQIEHFPRKYYAGCSGPLNAYDTKDTHLFVTLRCAHWKENSQMVYYAGGGLLKESDITEEWHEINTKKRTAECIVTKHISTI